MAQSYFRILDPKEYNRHMPYPPLGTIIAATYLEQLGYDINFYDGMMADNTHEIVERLDEIRPDLLILYDDEFNYLTKMALLKMRENTFRILEKSNELNIPCVVYTSDAIDHPNLYLDRGALVSIIGEGETVLHDLLEVLQKEKIILDKIQGIAYLDPETGEMIKTEKKPLRSDLDELPDPDYKHYVDIDKYRKEWLDHHGYYSINISTSRGCTYGCNWCAKPLWGRTYNALSPQRVALLFQKLKQEYKVDHVWITDDIFGLKKNWLNDFTSEINDMGAKIPYKCLSRADLLCRGDTVQQLSSSGCDTIWIGAESGSQRILDAMEKGTTVEQITEATQKVKDAGMDIAFFLQLGYLGETWEDINLTRKLVRDCLPVDIGISVTYPLPGTKFYDMVQSHLSEKQNWLDSEDLDMLFHGTYSRKLYRLVHQLIHNEYRFHLYQQYGKLRNWHKITYHGLKMVVYRLKVSKQLHREENQERKVGTTLPVVS